MSAAVLDGLLDAARHGAEPDDVTPPLGAGWTPARVAWLRAYHEDRLAGFAGGSQEETRAIRVDGRIVGASRLQRTRPPDPTEVEWGMWLVKEVRGQGLTHVILALDVQRAVNSGATRLVARTTAGNQAAIRVLQRAGALLHHGADEAVTARLALRPGTTRSAAPPLKYAVVERERRFLVRSIPSGVTRVSRITDRYLDGTRLRLREVVDETGAVVRKLGHKVRLADGPEAIACTSLYVDDAEWSVLGGLPTRTLAKTRYHVERDGLALAVDELPDGTLLAEIDDGDAAPARIPDWLDVIADVTLDERWTGAALAS